MAVEITAVVTVVVATVVGITAVATVVAAMAVEITAAVTVVVATVAVAMAVGITAVATVVVAMAVEILNQILLIRINPPEQKVGKIEVMEKPLKILNMRAVEAGEKEEFLAKVILQTMKINIPFL